MVYFCRIFVLFLMVVLPPSTIVFVLSEDMYDSDYEDLTNNGTEDCNGADCDETPAYYFFSDQGFMTEEEIWAEIQLKLDSNETKNFLATFESSFERNTLFEQLTACPYIPLCEFDLGVTHLKYKSTTSKNCCLPCSCEYPKCIMGGTCCLDIVHRYPNQSDLFRSGSKATSTCEKMSLSNGASVTNGLAVMMQSACPVNTSEPLKSNCTRDYSRNMRDIKDVVPVYDDGSLALYRNTYCAFCNDVLDERLKLVEVWLKCENAVSLDSEAGIIENAMAVESCSLNYNLPTTIRPMFCKMTVSKCNQTGLWLDYDEKMERACQMYRSIIQSNGTNFENVFCALCNGIHIRNPSACEWNLGYGSTDGSGSSFSFSGLLKLETNTEVAKGRLGAHTKCKENQLFDRVHGVCRNMFCSDHQALRNGQCIDTYSKLRNIIYTVFLKIEPVETLSLQDANSIANDVIGLVTDINWMDAGVCGLQMVYVTHGHKEHRSMVDILRSPLKSYIIRTEIMMNIPHDPNEFVGTLMSLNNLESGFLHVDETLKQMKSFKFRIEIVDRVSVQIFDDISKLTEFKDYYLPENFEIPLVTMVENFTYPGEAWTDDLEVPHLRGNDYLADCKMKESSINILKMKTCPQIAFPRNTSRWREIDAGVIMEHGNFLIQNSEFYFHENESLIVCVEVFERFLAHVLDIENHPLSAETILSVVSSSMSIVCLLFTLFIFTLLSKLRKTLPGKNTMCLVIALLCAHSMYLVTGLGAIDVGSTYCIAFGMVLHFTWLLSMFWMNICTYHMFHVLSRMKAISKDSGSYRFLFYHMYAITMSAIPVAINISVSKFTSGNYGYGNVVCYISTQKMVTFTFGIPVAFVVLTNIGMYVYVVFKIKMSTMVQRTVKHERNNLVIFAKLSTITGVTWIFGFITSWSDMTIFSYFFILLNAGQGIFIMLAFVFNIRVIKMFKSDILGQTVSSSTTGDESTKNSFTRQTHADSNSHDTCKQNAKL